MNSIMSITSVFILTSCLILTGCSALFMFNANRNLELLDSFNKIVFYIDTEYESEEQLKKIQDEVSGLSNVKSWRFISKQEALENYLKQLGAYEEFLEYRDMFDEMLKRNKIEHSIEIEYENIEDLGTLTYQIRVMEGVAKKNGEPNIKNDAETAELIKNIKNIIALVMAGFSIIIFVVAVFIILNTVRLSVHARKQEIIIMRYIGATNFFIVFPFLLEGIIIGIVSAIIAYFAQSRIYAGAISAIRGMEGGFGLVFIEFAELNIALFAAFMFIGVLCGIFGSGLSSRKYLQA